MIKFLQQGVNFLQQNELSKAKAAFEFVLNNVRGLPDCYYFLSKVAYKQNNIKEAKELLKTAIKFIYISVRFDENHKKAFANYKKGVRH